MLELTFPPAPDGEHITVHRDLAEVESAWHELQAHPCYVFQTYEWLSLWCKTSGQADHVEPFVVRVTDETERTKIIFPLGIRSRYGCRILVFLGGDVTDYNAPVFARGVASACQNGRLNKIWKQIESLAAADVVWLQRMPDRLADGANPMITEPHARHVDDAHAAGPLPSTFAAFAASRSSVYFSVTRRKRRQLERLGLVTLDVPESRQTIAAVVELMLRQKQRRLEETGKRPMPPHYQGFYRSLAAASIANGRPHVSCLRVDGQIVATHVGVVHRNRFYYLMPGYEAGPWAHYSVGRLLLQALVEWCIAQGIETFDMTVGNESYKRFWSNDNLKLYESRYPLTVRGASYLAAYRLKGLADRSHRLGRLFASPQ
jgi:CelD/BcsL family acetyltransferase involved in cellulose biosynthesis